MYIKHFVFGVLWIPNAVRGELDGIISWFGSASLFLYVPIARDGE